MRILNSVALKVQCSSSNGVNSDKLLFFKIHTIFFILIFEKFALSLFGLNSNLVYFKIAFHSVSYLESIKLQNSCLFKTLEKVPSQGLPCEGTFSNYGCIVLTFLAVAHKLLNALEFGVYPTTGIFNLTLPN